MVMFPSECTDLSGIVPGGPPRSLVMGVFPWKLNCIFLSHLLATANALSPQIRDRGLRNLPPLPRGVISNALDYGKLKHIWQLKWRKKGVARIIKNSRDEHPRNDQDDTPDEDENVSRRKKRAKADDEAHDDAADGDEDGDEDDDDDAGDDGDDDSDDGCGN